MKYALILLLLTGCATIKVGPQDDGSVIAQIPKEVVQQCEAEGGCAVVSEAFVKEFAMQFALKMCGKGI